MKLLVRLVSKGVGSVLVEVRARRVLRASSRCGCICWCSGGDSSGLSLAISRGSFCRVGEIEAGSGCDGRRVAAMVGRAMEAIERRRI